MGGPGWSLVFSDPPVCIHSRFPPAPESLRAPFSGLSLAFYTRCLATCSLLWTNAGGGRWLPPPKVLLADEACLADPRLRAVLVALGLPITCFAPRWLELLVLRLTPGAVLLSPAIVREHLGRQHRAHLAAKPARAHTFAATLMAMLASAASVGPSTLTSAVDVSSVPLSATSEPPAPACALLLDYLLSDCQLRTPLPASASARELPQPLVELRGLPLLPLADGSLGQILPCTEGAGLQYLFLSTSLEHQLLAGLKGAVMHLADGLPQTSQAKLTVLAASGTILSCGV